LIKYGVSGISGCVEVFYAARMIIMPGSKLILVKNTT